MPRLPAGHPWLMHEKTLVLMTLEQGIYNSYHMLCNDSLCSHSFSDDDCNKAKSDFVPDKVSGIFFIM